jgi:hypothetical protein
MKSYVHSPHGGKGNERGENIESDSNQLIERCREEARKRGEDCGFLPAPKNP